MSFADLYARVHALLDVPPVPKVTPRRKKDIRTRTTSLIEHRMQQERHFLAMERKDLLNQQISVLQSQYNPQQYNSQQYNAQQQVNSALATGLANPLGQLGSGSGAASSLPGIQGQSQAVPFTSPFVSGTYKPVVPMEGKELKEKDTDVLKRLLKASFHNEQ